LLESIRVELFYSDSHSDYQVFFVSQYDAQQNPIAVLSLSDAAKASGDLQHEIVLELRKGMLGVSRYRVVVTLAGDEFLAAYRQDRLANAQEKLPVAKTG